MSAANILQVFILVGASQGILLSLSIFKRSTRKNHNWLLGLAFLIISLRLLVYPFKDISISSFWQNIGQTSLLSLLLVGPAIFLFSYFKTRGNLKLKFWHLLHLLPFFYYITHLIYPYFQLPLCYSYSTLFSGSVYGICAIALLLPERAKHHRTQLYSLALPLLLIPVAILGLVEVSYSSLGFHPATIPYIALTFLLARMGLKSMMDSRIFFNRLLEFKLPREAHVDQERLKSLVDEVETQKFFLNQDLTIQTLSLNTDFTRHEISELLNKGLGRTFNEFINEYRIKTAQDKLLDQRFQHLSIAGIGHESGFKSKSSFNLVFKQLTGMTPSQFKAQSCDN